MGWQGNALLVRKTIEVVSAERIALPTLEPRGAVCAELRLGARLLRVVGMHLDLSGLHRRRQLRAVIAHLDQGDRSVPAVLMGDFNEWSARGGSLHEFGRAWQVLAPGRSFPARRPLAQLDRIVVSRVWEVLATGVHHSPLSARGSDHLPVYARLALHAAD
jgi:endonuclease/exonuclease/phosphatase family metal-dependent hydrolase